MTKLWTPSTDEENHKLLPLWQKLMIGCVSAVGKTLLLTQKKKNRTSCKVVRKQKKKKLCHLQRILSRDFLPHCSMHFITIITVIINFARQFLIVAPNYCYCYCCYFFEWANYGLLAWVNQNDLLLLSLFGLFVSSQPSSPIPLLLNISVLDLLQN